MHLSHLGIWARNLLRVLIVIFFYLEIKESIMFTITAIKINKILNGKKMSVSFKVGGKQDWEFFYRTIT